MEGKTSVVTCEFCGHNNQDGSKYCSSCGRPVLELAGEETGSLVPLEASGDLLEEGLRRLLLELPKGIGFLVIRSGDIVGSWFALEKPVTRIGRHPDSDIFLDDVTVSRRHAEVTRDSKEYVITDVGSLNGTYQNKQRVDEGKLHHGDEIQIGKYRFFYAFYGIDE